MWSIFLARVRASGGNNLRMPPPPFLCLRTDTEEGGGGGLGMRNINISISTPPRPNIHTWVLRAMRRAKINEQNTSVHDLFKRPPPYPYIFQGVGNHLLGNRPSPSTPLSLSTPTPSPAAPSRLSRRRRATVSITADFRALAI